MKNKTTNSINCCNPSSGTPVTSDTKREIRKRYGELTKNSAADPISSRDYVIEQAGYSPEELQLLPEKASAASAGCGNPTALAGLKKGEIVLDLGSGGGIDVFLAAKKVGPKGLVIGVDMTPEMIDLARENAGKGDVTNVEFRLGEIEHLPVADDTIDVIISNCVINLSAQKEQVFKEAYRVLRKGGRLFVSDMMVKGIPEEVRRNVLMWASCIGGAIELEAYTDTIRRAGLTKIEVISNTKYSLEMINNLMASMKSDLNKKETEELKNLEHAVKVKIEISHAEISAMKV
ncbi:arsenite methyltransferase [Candidatus Bathyarchaeota archaeon]|nr:arsenite methyltransferase [Candidatus Bathyarchaeota archaeon]